MSETGMPEATTPSAAELATASKIVTTDDSLRKGFAELETPPQAPATKPGWQTTEFWTTLIVHMVNALVLCNVIPVDNAYVKAVALVCSAVAQAVYTSGRNSLKASLQDSASMLMILVCVGATAAGAMTGCAQTETQAAAASMIAITGQAQTVDTLVVDGLVDQAEATKLQGMVHDEQAAVNSYYAAIENNDSPGLAAAKAALATATQALTQELAKYPLPSATTKAASQPATKPATKPATQAATKP